MTTIRSCAARLHELLDKVGGDLRRGHYPNAGQGTKVAAILRKVADDLDA